jgi:hypothetical protein
MIHKKLIMIFLCLLIALPSLNAANENNGLQKKIYFFGIAKSYADSVTFLTGIVPMDNVNINKNTKGVDNLEMYTEQLNNYFKQQGLSGYICATFFSEKSKDIEKQYLKLKKKISKQKGMTLKVLNDSDFKYNFVDSKKIYHNEITKPDSEQPQE